MKIIHAITYYLIFFNSGVTTIIYDNHMISFFEKL